MNIGCPSCNTLLEVSAELVGMKIQCPECEQKCLLPDTVEELEGLASDFKPRTKTEVKPRTKTEVKPRTKTEVKPRATPARPKTAVSPRKKPEPQPDPKPAVHVKKKEVTRESKKVVQTASNLPPPTKIAPFSWPRYVMNSVFFGLGISILVILLAYVYVKSTKG